MSSSEIFRIRGKEVLQMQASALLGVKNFGFFDIYDVSAQTRGEEVLSQCGQGERVSFSRFCAGVFFGRPFIIIIYLFIYYLFIFSVCSAASQHHYV